MLGSISYFSSLSLQNCLLQLSITQKWESTQAQSFYYKDLKAIDINSHISSVIVRLQSQQYNLPDKFKPLLHLFLML